MHVSNGGSNISPISTISVHGAVDQEAEIEIHQAVTDQCLIAAARHAKFPNRASILYEV